MQKIIYTRPDGGLSVVHPVEGARLAFFVTLSDGTVLPKGADTPAFDGVKPMPVDSIFRRWPVEGAVAKWAETEDEFVARIAAKDVPSDASDVRIVDASVIPTDRTFRNAWRACPKNGCRIDMAAAAEIHKQTLRTLRAPKLAALDVEYMRALETGDQMLQTEITAKKQALRDVTKDPAVAAAKTPEALISVVPAALRDI